MNTISVLKDSPLFRGWKDSELSLLAHHCLSRELSPGETLFFENETSTSLYLIGRGTITIKRLSQDDAHLVTLGTNEVLGEMSMLTTSSVPDKRIATAEATEASTVIEVPFAGLASLMSESPTTGLSFYRNLYVILSHRIHRVDDDIIEVKKLRLRHT